AEGRRQKAEGRRQKAEGRRQKAEGRRQKAEGRRQKAEGRRQKAEVPSLFILLLSAFCFPPVDIRAAEPAVGRDRARTDAAAKEWIFAHMASPSLKPGQPG
ncbi:MAG: hypothetical protein ACXWLY_23965, partial [Thermoanaerobaculia bacterium]